MDCCMWNNLWRYEKKTKHAWYTKYTIFVEPTCGELHIAVKMAERCMCIRACVCVSDFLLPCLLQSIILLCVKGFWNNLARTKWSLWGGFLFLNFVQNVFRLQITTNRYHWWSSRKTRTWRNNLVSVTSEIVFGKNY